MSAEALSCISSDKIYSRTQFSYNQETDFLDAGGFAEVYKAQLQDSQVVAAKVLVGGKYRKSRLNEGELHSLKKEAAILLRLEGHKNIVRLIGICDDPNCYALLLEYVPDGNLRELLLSKDTKMASWENKLDVAHQISDGMCHLHSQSPPVIHQDLKPGNVLCRLSLEGNIECKITDFGLSKMRGVSSQTTGSSDGARAPAGTPAFIAPERYQVEYDVSRNPQRACKADVYRYCTCSRLIELPYLQSDAECS
jgi:serine/threonine protein kinase